MGGTVGIVRLEREVVLLVELRNDDGGDRSVEMEDGRERIERGKARLERGRVMAG